eukprot:CAMPEP_0198153166 /NCGR_PEP_ID=MMETSP1443-20131203/62952_1 /TAXON_ID=186043 /ORGANISM="Entomoneis sp., Strain CCMP2396" /LENGTH=398 /DNA_ID=CAMNT_0043819409 /DNA_START=186 /DNA_END=1382 /DNA_ORIENTATION=-
MASGDSTLSNRSSICGNTLGMVESGIQEMPLWISLYTKDHRRSACEMKSITKSHQNKDLTKRHVGFIRWVCRNKKECGGLGDRLYGIVMTFYIAMLTNRTLILEGWSDQGVAKMADFLEPALIAWDAPISHANPAQTNLIKIMDKRNHPLLLEPCNQLVSGKSNAVVEVQNNIMTYDHILRNSDCFKQYCGPFGGCSDDDRSLFHLGFWTLFRFTPGLVNQANLLRRAAGLVDGQAYISMHVRTGQGETWDDPLRHNGDENLNRFYQCGCKLQQAMQKYCTNISYKPSVYIAADNNYAKSRIQRWDSSDTFKSESDIEVVHIGKTRYEEIKDPRMAYSQVWGELKVLIDSSCIVMSRSKFSYMGSELSPRQPRCAVLFDNCGDDKVRSAVSSLGSTCK